MSTSDLRFIGKLKYRSTNTESPYPVSDALKPFLGYLANHRSGVLIAESGRGRSYVSGCICAELAEKGQLGVIVSLESYVSPDVQSLISPANLSDLQQFNQIPLIILDGYEHLLNKGGSLQAIINSLHHYFAEKAIHILVTCLPIDCHLLGWFKPPTSVGSLSIN